MLSHPEEGSRGSPLPDLMTQLETCEDSLLSQIHQIPLEVIYPVAKLWAIAFTRPKAAAAAKQLLLPYRDVGSMLIFPTRKADSQTKSEAPWLLDWGTGLTDWSKEMDHIFRNATLWWLTWEPAPLSQFRGSPSGKVGEAWEPILYGPEIPLHLCCASLPRSFQCNLAS